LVLVSLVTFAVVLVVRSGFFSSGPLSEDQTSSVWAFLGVSLGAVVTMIGALLAEQNNRRTQALTREAAQREALAKQQQQKLAEEAEERLGIDSVAKILELVTVEQGYAPRARVAGAIATMVQLRGGSVAVRILGELWKDDGVDSDTAVWLIDRILKESKSDDEVTAAAFLLGQNVSKLVPAPGDSSQDWTNFPPTLERGWPAHLPSDAKNEFIVLAPRVLLVRDIAWWKGLSTVLPVDLLVAALDDQEYGLAAAFVLSALLDSGALDELDYSLDDEQRDRVKTMISGLEFPAWFQKLVDGLEPWARGEPIQGTVPTSAAAPVIAVSDAEVARPPAD
jgi:hypothetical protein